MGSITLNSIIGLFDSRDSSIVRSMGESNIIQIMFHKDSIERGDEGVLYCPKHKKVLFYRDFDQSMEGFIILKKPVVDISKPIFLRRSVSDNRHIDRRQHA